MITTVLGFTEKGWQIYDYFPNPGQFKVSAEFTTFTDESMTNVRTVDAGGPIGMDLKVTHEVPADRSEIVIEFWRWALGFLVAVIGLFAGAKEKILSLDTLAAVFAVFMLGFSIDMAKNLLLPKQA